MSELRWNPLMGEWLATAPFGKTARFCRRHIEFYPPMRTATKLKFLAGGESGAGMFINDTLAEEKAAELRGHISDFGF